MNYSASKMTRLITGIAAVFLIQGMLGGCKGGSFSKTQIIMDTTVQVTSPYPTASGIIFDEIQRLGALLDRYNPQSDIGRINAKAGIQPVVVAPETIEVLLFAKETSWLSKGAFDVTIGPLVDLWKPYMSQQGDVNAFPDKGAIEEARRLVDSEKIMVDKKRKTVYLKTKGMSIDLGGLAKGFVIDKAVKRLKREGIHDCLINAGGDIYCLGKNKGRPWKVAIQHPRNKEDLVETLELSGSAIATSGDYERFFEYKGKRYSHIINPRTGWPVENNVISTTVEAANCSTADALASAIFVLGKQEGEKLFRGYFEGTGYLLVITEEHGKLIFHNTK